MTSESPVERISGLLLLAGYQPVALPLKVGAIEFDVPAAFLGTAKSMDLVLVFDTAFQPILKVSQTVSSIARALDIARSRRPLTTIVTGVRPDSRDMESVTRVSRVLTATDGKNDEDALAVLLPLKLPKVSDEAPDVVEVLTALKNGTPAAKEFVNLAASGEAAVQNRLIQLLEEPFASISELGAEL